MRGKLLILSTFLLLGLGLTRLQAQIMYVKQSNGTQTSYALSNIQNISLSSGKLTVTKTDNNSGIYSLSDLKYFNFTDLSANLDNQLLVQNQILSAYPNPANNLLNVVITMTYMEKGYLSIHNIEGKTLLRRQVGSEEILSIDIHHLPNGIYLCQLSNSKVVKTVRFVKQ